MLDESFTTAQPGWPNDRRATAWFDGGSYHLLARQPARFVAIGVPSQSFGDVVVRATFRKIDGPPGGGYGLIVRNQNLAPLDGLAQGGRYYVLEVGEQGKVGVWRREQDHWVDLLPWTSSDKVHLDGRADELVARAVGERLTLTVNNAQVADVVDPALLEGSVGVFVGGDGNDVALDAFKVQIP